MINLSQFEIQPFHSLPTEVEKEQLIEAFKAAGFLDEVMQSRIDDHFAAFDDAEKAFAQIHEKNTFFGI